MKTITVVGAGVIGSSWAACFLANGLDVVVTDPGEGAEEALHTYVDQAWPLLESSGMATGASVDRLSFVADLAEAVGRADFVQENGPERSDFKVDLFAKLDEAARPETILASSSSGLTMDVIQAKCVHPERCVIGHPFNPPHVIPLVEVVGGAKTSERTVEQAMAFYAGIGKKPIRLKKAIAGHVANRLQAALYKEILYLVGEQVLDVADADAAVCYGPGLRWAVMGPSLQWHVGGGKGGIKHYMDQLMGPLEGLIRDLKMPDLGPDTHAAIIEGVLGEAGGEIRRGPRQAGERGARQASPAPGRGGAMTRCPSNDWEWLR